MRLFAYGGRACRHDLLYQHTGLMNFTQAQIRDVEHGAVQ